jgi:SAM-dependent methyltransferase
MAELARVLKKEGLLIISTPNVQNFFARYQLACTGYLYQFHPFHITPPEKDMIKDRGHINPVFYTQLRYFSQLHGLKVLKPEGDRYKRIIALPFFLPFILIGYWWSLRDWRRAGKPADSKEIIDHLFNMKTLFSRSFIFKAVKL